MDSSSRSSAGNQSLNSVQQLTVGETIGGRFIVDSFIRQDFAGEVYLARDSQSERLIECLMINLPDEKVKRLLALRERISDVKEVNLKSFANTYGIGKQGGHGYMVRQQLEGRTLTEYLNYRIQQAKPFKQRALCSLLIEIIQGLDALKKQKPDVRLHGLLRPSAILVQNKAKPRVRMTDLGLSVLREDLKDNPEVDMWTRGCIPELRGGVKPHNCDLYSLGALLYQMTQLRPFHGAWRDDLINLPHFPKLEELIERCTSLQQNITLTELKDELKIAAKSQVGEGGLTDDLSQLQERLHKIMSNDEIPIDPVSALAPEESIAGIYSDGYDKTAYESNPSEEAGLFKTPLPMNFQTPLPTQAQTTSSDDAQVDMSHFNMSGFEAELTGRLKSTKPTSANYEPVISSAQAPIGMGADIDSEQDAFLSSARDPQIGELLSAVETYHGAELILEEEEEISAPQIRVAPPAPPPAPPKPRAIDPDAPRWLVMKGGIDYGPYSQDQIIKQLFGLEISPDTELCDMETGERATLAEFPEMEDLLATWVHKKAEFEARNAELMRKRRIRQKLVWSLSAIVAVGLSVGGFLYGPQIYESMLPPPAALSKIAWAQDFPKMKALEKLQENPEVKAERLRLAQAAKAKRASDQEARAMAQEAREASTVNVNLDGKAVGREFSSSLATQAINQRKSSLMKCITAEMERSPSTSLFKVSVTVQPSGRFINARLTNGTNAGDRCVFRAIRNLKMLPFDGSDRTISIPFQVR